VGSNPILRIFLILWFFVSFSPASNLSQNTHNEIKPKHLKDIKPNLAW
jgi:hypothetical protein